MKIMQKKLSKSLLVSVLALIIIGSAAAAFTWISNIRTTTVTVRENFPILLTGDFVDSPMAWDEINQIFNYTLTNPNPTFTTGYIFVQFQAPGETLNLGDINTYGSVNGNPMFRLITGYPLNSAPDTLTFLFGETSTTPINFGSMGLNGTILLQVIYKVAYSINASIAITSTY